MAIIFYERLYKQKGIRRQAHIFNPRVLDATEFIFPTNSVMVWWKGDENNHFITKAIPYFQKVDRGVVSSVFGYASETELYGKAIPRTMNPSKWVKESQDQCKEFKFLKIGQQFKITPKMLRILNFGCVSSKYKYPNQVLRRYHIYRNVFRTVLKVIATENTERDIFINIDLPKEMLPRIVLTKLSKKLLNGHLDLLPTYEYFNMLEFWKFLSPEYKSESLIHQCIPKERWNKVNILFCIDKKVVLIRLSVLAALVKDYGVIEPMFKEKDAEMAKKMFHKFISLILETAAMSDAELEKLESKLDNPESGPKKQLFGKKDDEGVDPDDLEYVDDEEDESLGDVVDTAEATDEADFEEEEEEPTDTDEPNDLNDEDEDEVEEEIIVGDAEDTSIPDIEYENLEKLLEESNEFDHVYKQLDTMLNNKAISKKDYETNYRILSEIPKRKDPYGSKRSLIEMLDHRQDDTELKKEDIEITDNPVIFDKSYNKNVTGNIIKKYIENQYEKDIVRTVYALQNSNTIIEDYQIFKNETILGGTEEHVISTRSLTGKPSNIKIVLPKIEPDGTFKISNQTYTMRSQRADIPIRKISSTRAALSSYFGKLFVEKASFKKQDTGYYLFNSISKMYAEGIVTDLIALPVPTRDVTLPIDYTHLARYIKGFKFKDYLFTLDYTKREKVLGVGSAMEYEKGGKYVVVGIKGKNPIVMETATSLLYTADSGGKTFTEIGTIYTLLQIDRLKQPVEYCDVKVFGTRIPMVAILGYYVGLDQLMKLLKVKYEKHEANKRVPVEVGWYIVKFKDIKLKIKRDYGIQDVIIGSLTAIEKATSQVQYKVMNVRASFQVLWNKLGYQLIHTNEIKLMENMFVDPITLSMLEKLKLPTNLKGLLIKACEMLVDDNYKNPNDLGQMLIKGYERVSGMMYNELVKAQREQENKSVFSKAKMVVNPYGVIQAMNEDSATTLVDDLNPMASLKQIEDVTYLGALGRQKISMNQVTREYNTSEVGVISEASKDSSDVGITAYLTAAPSIDNIRGKTKDIDIEKEGWSSVLSSSGMLSPFGINDDSKRLNFASIMNSHIIPINNMRVPYVRTGYEAIVPIRVNDKFCITAEEDGKVLSVTKNEVTIDYVKQGKKKYKMKSWTSKEEAGSCYVHKLVTNLKPGDKIIKDDTIIYDHAFFEPDIFNPKRVVYKQGDVITVALMEDKETFEDSAGIHKRLSDRLGTTVTKIKSTKLSKDDHILNMVKPGDKVEPTDVLFTVTDPIFANAGGLDEKTISILKDLKSVSPKAKVKGTIEKIEVRYNCERDDLSPSLKELAIASDEKLIESFGFPGKVNSSYSIEGVPLMADEVHIKVYINTGDHMGIGDKAIMGNQLKFTVGEVFDYDIATEDGTDIDATFGLTSIMARIVCSPIAMGTAGMCIEKLEQKAIEMYFGKK